MSVGGGGVADIVFEAMDRLVLDFEPRIPRLSDRRRYAFEPSKRYGRLAPLFGHRLTRDLIVSHWPDIERVIRAMLDRPVTPSLILKNLSDYPQQTIFAAAHREVCSNRHTSYTIRLLDSTCHGTTGHRNSNTGEGRQK